MRAISATQAPRQPLTLAVMAVVVPKCPVCYVAYCGGAGLVGLARFSWYEWILWALLVLILADFVRKSFRSAARWLSIPPALALAGGFFLLAGKISENSSGWALAAGIALIFISALWTHARRLRDHAVITKPRR